MDFQNIKELIRIFDKSELSKLEIKEGDFKIALQKGFEGGVVSYAPAQQISAPVSNVSVQASAPVAAALEAAPVAASNNGLTLKAPMVGTFYRSPSPEASAFVKEGDVVKKGQTICILEAMKIMNEVEAEFDCKILKFLVDDGSPVEFDMPMFAVERV